MNRADMISRIASRNKKFDFIIIGGGATGIGILLEAVSRGYSAVLLEASDFTKSTSSKSTKLVHGGVRYLAQGNIGLVREASVERGRLLKNAPHVVKNISFIIPCFNLWDTFLYSVGLKFYDLLAGTLSLGRSKSISRSKVSEQLPNLKPNRLKAGVLYHDGQFDDSRLAVNILRTATESGGIAVNYMPVTKLVKNETGRIVGIEALDKETGEKYKIKGQVIVNATGVFADSIMEMDHEHHKISIKPSQGIHIVIDKKYLPGEVALMIPKTDDGRVLFAVPWHDKVIVGTTDTPVDHISDEPVALESEIEFILTTLARYMVTSPEKKDILSMFAGLRPLAVPAEGKSKTKEISRSHKIILSTSGLLTIIGGKWTTYRKMGEDLVNRAEKEHGIKRTRSKTHNLRIQGYKKDTDFNHPLYFYGNEDIESITKKKGGKDSLVSEKLNIYESQVLHGIKSEMARNPEDILARRTRALFLDARESIRITPKVAEIIAKERGMDKEWVKRESAAFISLAEKYLPG